MKKILSIVLILAIMFSILIPSVSAHGVDITADTMIMADDSNGVLAKEIADENNVNISVYKFTSEDEVAHQLEHMLTNDNKRILVLTYQNTAKTFLNEHSDLSDRLIIVDDVNNDTIKEGILSITNTNTQQEDTSTNFTIALVSGIFVGFVIGLACGVLIMKKKKNV